MVPRHKALILIAAALFLGGCSLPRIIVLNDPLTPEERVNLGVAYEKNGEYEAAMREYEAASRKLPIAHLYMGNIHYQQGDIGKAEKAYRKAIRKTGDPRGYNNLAWLYFTEGGRLVEAEELARKAVELGPDNVDFRDTLNKIREKRQTTKPSLPTEADPATHLLVQ